MAVCHAAQHAHNGCDVDPTGDEDQFLGVRMPIHAEDAMRAIHIHILADFQFFYSGGEFFQVFNGK